MILKILRYVHWKEKHSRGQELAMVASWPDYYYFIYLLLFFFFGGGMCRQESKSAKPPKKGVGVGGAG